MTLTPDHHICIQDESDELYLFAKIGIEVKKGLQMLELMAKTGKIDAKLWEEKQVIVSEALLESLTDAYKRRTNDCITIDEIRNRDFDSSYINPLKEGVNVGGDGVSVSIPPTITPQKATSEELMYEKKDNNPAQVTVPSTITHKGKERKGKERKFITETAPDGVKNDRTIYHLIEEAFVNKNQEFNYKREGPHIKQLEEKCLARASPEDFAKALLVTFWKLTHSAKEKLFKDKPFLPSILDSGGLYPYVLKAMENQELTDWDIVEVF